MPDNEKLPVKTASDYDFVLSLHIGLLKTDLRDLIAYLETSKTHYLLLKRAKQLQLTIEYAEKAGQV